MHNPNPSFSGALGPAQENTAAPGNTGPYQTPDYVGAPRTPPYVHSLIPPLFVSFLGGATATTTRAVEFAVWLKQFGTTVAIRKQSA